MFSLVQLHCEGTKNVAKELAKITKGRVRDQDVIWFTELADKRMLLVHVYTKYLCNNVYFSQEGALKSISTGL